LLNLHATTIELMLNSKQFCREQRHRGRR
jgi:hypothetical protein